MAAALRLAVCLCCGVSSLLAAMVLPVPYVLLYHSGRKCKPYLYFVLASASNAQLKPNSPFAKEKED